MPATLIRKRKPRLKYPLPFAKLPDDIKALAIERWRDANPWPDWDDGNYLTEDLEQDLEYEFGIEVAQDHRKMASGKTISTPRLCWDACPLEASFIDKGQIDDILAHGVPGCEYFHPEAERLMALLAKARFVESLCGCDIEWSLSVSLEGREYTRRADWNCQEAVGASNEKMLGQIADEMDSVLEAYYDKACSRLCKIIDSEIDYRNSDECIAETLQANEWEFDEEGRMV